MAALIVFDNIYLYKTWRKAHVGTVSEGKIDDARASRFCAYRRLNTLLESPILFELLLSWNGPFPEAARYRDGHGLRRRQGSWVSFQLAERCRSCNAEGVLDRFGAYICQNHTVPYGTVFWGGALPGSSCQATIASSLRGLSDFPSGRRSDRKGECQNVMSMSIDRPRCCCR